MPRSIDKVELVILSLILVYHLNGMALYRDAFLPLKVHIIQHLIGHISGTKGACGLYEPVGKSALAVVDVRYDAKIANTSHFHNHSQI